MDERPRGTEEARDPVGRNVERLQRVFAPMRRRIEEEAQTQLSMIDRKVTEVADILYRYNITEPLDFIFFDELIFHIEMHIIQKEADDPNYFEQERVFVERCRRDLATRRSRGL